MVHVFSDKGRAEEFARKKNAKVRKGKWVVEKGKRGGWVVWHKKSSGFSLFQ